MSPGLPSETQGCLRHHVKTESKAPQGVCHAILLLPKETVRLDTVDLTPHGTGEGGTCKSMSSSALWAWSTILGLPDSASTREDSPPYHVLSAEGKTS